MINRKIRTLRLICLLLVLANLSPQRVLAHAFPDHSEPRVGATVQDSPSRVSIWFDGELESVFTTIRVEDINGRRVDKGNGGVNKAEPTLLEVELPQLTPGTYRVIWDVLARDGHRTKGDYTFTIK
jgi:copper resistance protein C